MNTSQSTYTLLANKEKASGGRKIYPGMNFLRIPRRLLPRKLQVICELYELLRRFDEYCDDAPLDNTSVNAVKTIISEKSRTIIENHVPIGNISMNTILQDAVKSSMNVLMWDHERRIHFNDTKTLFVPDESEIRNYIDDLEGKGVILPLLSLLGVGSVDLTELSYILEASRRYFYFGRDLREDLENGFCNISREELTQIGIGEEDMRNPNNQVLQQVEEYMQEQSGKFLERHNEMKPILRKKLGSIGYFTVGYLYERGARQFIQQFPTNKYTK